MANEAKTMFHSVSFRELVNQPVVHLASTRHRFIRNAKKVSIGYTHSSRPTSAGEQFSGRPGTQHVFLKNQMPNNGAFQELHKGK